jgi:hypothetical protein
VTHTDDTERKAFEAWISAPPFEQNVRRYGNDPQTAAWPGNYREYNVQLAWCAWEARAALRQCRAARWERQGLRDPVLVHAAMLRGEIATPAIRDMLHVYGAEALARWDAAPSVPSGEPVAWIYQNSNTEREYLVWQKGTGGRNWQPLYAASQPAPAGWQWVPVVPTHAMVRAWRSQSPGGRFHEESWIAMLDAAPAAPGGAQ